MQIDRLAIQTYCFRGFGEHSQVIEAVRECGLSYVEMSPVHVDYTDPGAARAALDAYRDAGIGIVGIGVIEVTLDETPLRRACEFARSAGGRVVSVNFSPDRFLEKVDLAQRLAEEYDVRLAIHNHGGRHWLGNPEILRHVFATTGKRIGLCLDTAWALDAGEDPVAMARIFRERLYSLHLKDFAFDSARRPKDVPVGSGNLNLKGLLTLVDSTGFDGPCILEYEGDLDNPVPAIQECVSAVKRVADVLA